MIEIIIWVILPFFDEAITEIVVESQIMFRVRNFFSKLWPGFFGELLKCGYCFSVWPAIILAFFIPTVIFENSFLDYLVKWMFIHRMSNVYHSFISKLSKPQIHVVQKIDNAIDNIVEIKDG
jgi:hypothetical protein